MVCSLAVCAQGLILNILLGIRDPLSGGLFTLMLSTVCIFQFIYGYTLHRKGTLREESRKDIDLGLNEENILSEFINN
jgi:hypothetical protein